MSEGREEIDFIQHRSSRARGVAELWDELQAPFGGQQKCRAVSRFRTELRWRSDRGKLPFCSQPERLLHDGTIRSPSRDTCSTVEVKDVLAGEEGFHFRHTADLDDQRSVHTNKAHRIELRLER